MDYNKIGQFIAERRKYLNLTQKQLAQKLNLTDKAVSKWERGLGCPDVSILGELSEILEVGIGEILNGEYNENLKNNSEFIKNAVDYSKKITEDNLMSKIRKILYCILILIVFYISFKGVKQFIWLNNEIEINLSEELLTEYEKMKDNISTITNGDYLDESENNEVYVSFLNNSILYFESSKILSPIKKHYEVALLASAFMYLEANIYISSVVLYEIDPDNSKYYALLDIYEDVYIFDDIATYAHNGKSYYYSMYEYDRFSKNVDFEYYYNTLNDRMKRVNKALEFIIEIGDKDV